MENLVSAASAGELATELMRGYRETGFACHLDMKPPYALVMIDMARAYFELGSPFDLGDAGLAQRAKALLHCARDAGIVVAHTRLEYDLDGRNGGLFFKKIGALKAFCAGSRLAEFVPGLEPLDGELVVTKQYASAFFGTSLASTLHNLGVKTLIISGVSTSGCVRASAVDALAHGFVPVVVRDAVGDRHESLQNANLMDLQAKYAEVVDTHFVCDQLVKFPYC